MWVQTYLGCWVRTTAAGSVITGAEGRSVEIVKDLSALLFPQPAAFPAFTLKTKDPLVRLWVDVYEQADDEQIAVVANVCWITAVSG